MVESDVLAEEDSSSLPESELDDESLSLPDDEEESSEDESLLDEEDDDECPLPSASELESEESELESESEDELLSLSDEDDDEEDELDATALAIPLTCMLFFFSSKASSAADAAPVPVINDRGISDDEPVIAWDSIDGGFGHSGSTIVSSYFLPFLLPISVLIFCAIRFASSKKSSSSLTPRFPSTCISAKSPLLLSARASSSPTLSR